MPSSPMLTIPARSEKSPPRPASRIGTAHRSIDWDDPAAVRLSVSSKLWTVVRTNTPTAA